MVGRVWKSGDDTHWSLWDRFVDVFCFFLFSFLDGEAGVRKTAASMMSTSVKNPRKDFFVKDFLGEVGIPAV